MIQYCSHTVEKCGLSPCLTRGCILNNPTSTLDQMVAKYWREMERLGLGEFKTTDPFAIPMPDAKFFRTIENKGPKCHNVSPRMHHRTRFVHLIVGGQFVPCHYCGSLLLPRQTSMDHIIPKSKGGGLGKDNIVPACKPCNTAKGQMEYYEFLRKATSLGIFLRADRVLERDGSSKKSPVNKRKSQLYKSMLSKMNIDNYDEDFNW